MGGPLDRLVGAAAGPTPGVRSAARRSRVAGRPYKFFADFTYLTICPRTILTP